MSLAPIVLFVFRRPQHTEQVLRALLENPELEDSELWIFCEGARHSEEEPLVAETRSVVRRLARAGSLRIVERERNLGCAASILAGIGEVLARHERIIVLEDDLVVSRHFLGYMNRALERYAACPDVFHVSAYQYPIDLEDQASALLLPIINPWGWGTWRRAWQHFRGDYRELAQCDRSWWRRFRMDTLGAFELRKAVEQARERRLDEWDVRWSYSVGLDGGLGLFPRRSLVATIGFDGSGTHSMPLRYAIAPDSVRDASEDAFPEPTRPTFADVNRYAQRISGGLSLYRRAANHLRGHFGWRYSLGRSSFSGAHARP